jgi:hypothetical protein
MNFLALYQIEMSLDLRYGEQTPFHANCVKDLL